MTFYSLKRKDGSIGITDLHVGTIEDILKEMHPKNINHTSNIESFRKIKASDRPIDSGFPVRTWEDDGKTISINMDKAKVFYMECIREKRDERLTELDKRQYGESFDIERQTLRDLPKTVDLSQAKTTEELKKLWPKEL